MTETEWAEVQSAEKMDKATFAMHFTHRHQDSLARQTELPSSISDEIEKVYRAFHNQIHRARVGLGHYHNEI